MVIFPSHQPLPGVPMVDKSRTSGFTLVELMIVVVIIGVLASIAVPAFISYVYRARAAEAPTFLGEIRQRQESYRSEFGQYAAVSANFTDLTPSASSGASLQMWPVAASTWDELGARPDGPTRFQYSCVAGLPGTTPPGGLGFDGSDFWFVSHAVADLNEDGIFVTFESYSASNLIWNSSVRKWE